MWQFFALEPVWTIAIAVVLGLVIGSWLTVVGRGLPLMMEHRWQQEMHAYQQSESVDRQGDGEATGGVTPQTSSISPSLSLSGQHCLACDAPVRGWRRLPLLGWVLAQGRCADCLGGIGWRYPIAELVTALLFGLCAWRFGVSVMTLWAMGLCAALVLLSWIDLHTRLLPDVITLPLMWAGLLMNLDGALVPLRLSVLGAVVGYLSLWLLFHLFRLITGREGMGYGDFKLLAALGAWFGLTALPMILLVASLAGIVAAIGMRWVGYAQRDQALPFGPYLALAGVMVLFTPAGRAIGF